MESATYNLGNLLALVKYPLMTQKSYELYGMRQYTFIVDRSLRKPEIKYIFEKIFDVKITSISTMILPSKSKKVGRFIGKKSLYKKVIIKLKEGDSIKNLFE
jgi:large subunit ribosomal protein L23